MFRPLAVLFTCAFAASCLVAQDIPKLRLSGDVRPVRYEMDLKVVPSADGYSGHIAIEAEIKRSVNTVWLHATDLKLTKAVVGSRTATVVSGGKEFVGLQLPSAAPAGKTRIEIDFSGTFNKNDVEGFFKQSDNGNSYVLSQFEPTSARRAFPCFDEPAMKVPWKLTLRVPKDMGAFANTPVEAESEEGGLKVVRFAETKPLPSYLIAIAVGPFDIAEGGKAGRKGFPIRVLAPKGRAAEAAYVNQVTPKIVASLEEYFGMPYPYEKLDQATIPITVGFGAMENAGLITYNQTLILARTDDDTIERQRRAANVVTHELAHQWFGNMVTPAWWDDIWLNEAFATWMANRVVGTLFPDWEAPARAVEAKAGAMEQDQLITARKVRQPIAEHGDIGNAFDRITYQKGAAVIRMFENYVGSDRFQKGVQTYMRKHMWGNATASDFLASISGAAGKDVTPAFSKFLDRGGVPLLKVNLKCDGQPRVSFSQERSLPLGSKGSKEEYWASPVCIRYEADGKVTRDCILLTDPKEEIALRGAGSCPTWLTANDQGTGYYHVIYQGDLNRKLVSNTGKLSMTEQVDLLLNALALVRSGRMPAGDALALAREFRNGPGRELISASMDVVTSVRRSVAPEQHAAFAKMIREFYGEKARELGWRSKQGESADARLLRPAVLGLVAGIGADPMLASQARELAKQWLNDRKSIEAETATAVLEVAARHGDRTLYEQYLTEARRSKSRVDRVRIIKAMGQFPDPRIAASALGLMLTGELDVRELLGLLESFQENPETERAPWEFVTTNYEKLLPRLPSRLGTAAGSILPSSGGAFCDTSGYQQVERFFRERIREVSGGARMLSKVLEQIQLCEARVREQKPEMARFLKQYAD